MIFVVFILLLWAAALFHRAEHRALPQELRDLGTPKDAAVGAHIAGHDFRLMEIKNGGFVLKRAFHPQDRRGVLRYALPVLFLAGMMIYLQNIPLSAGYFVFLCLRWFGTEIVLYPASESRFRVQLWQKKIYEDTL